MVVLACDASVVRLKRSIRDYALVYGIREAKGLEFPDVLLLDFFSDIPWDLQKPFRELLLGRAGGAHFGTLYPEMEGHLKLLYTAVTRSMNRLFFAETKSSLAGDAFVRWLTTCSTNSESEGERSEALATRRKMDDLKNVEQTPDELRALGFENALTAESFDDDLHSACDFMDKALYYFKLSDDAGLCSKARVFRSSISLRSRLVDAALANMDNGSLSSTEIEVADNIKSLLLEGLTAEAVKLCQDALPLLLPYSRQEVQKQIMEPLLNTNMRK